MVKVVKLKSLLKIFVFLSLFVLSLEANLYKKSAIFYYAKSISYSLVGIHDYIVVEPKNVNIYKHGFSVYKKNIYARVLFKNKSDKELDVEINKLLNDGYENLYFEIDEKSQDRSEYIKTFAQNHKNVKILLHADLDTVKNVYAYVEAISVENYNSKSIQDVEKLESYGVDIIDIEFKTYKDIDDTQEEIDEIVKKGMIPYITNHAFNMYGKSSKNAIKREILTLIDESKVDRMLLSAHQHGALVFEYLGYIEKLFDISKGLPKIGSLKQYAGIVVWLPGTYSDSDKLIQWVKDAIKENVKVTFVNNFGTQVDVLLLKQLGIDMFDSNANHENKKKIVQKNKMVGFETEPTLSETDLFFEPANSTPLYTVEDKEHKKSVPAAITPWGGYALQEAFLVEFGDENIWAINPFEFFQKTLRLKPLLVPDTTTENGNRLLFTHLDGDGIMNAVESDPTLYSGDIILKKILKPYKIPHSVSIIGAEVDNNGLYPKIAKRLQSIVKKFYKLDNVEAATHTFTHPFKWGKIDKNGFLPLKYRLKVANYNFSIEREIKQSIEEINNNYEFKEKGKAKTVFWSGDCMPRTNALEYIYKNNILNINGGYTTIRNAAPWLTLVSPLGLERDGYYQIYTGAQNENVYTNDWLGPFWGFKKVVQTFKLTNSPRRLKPIDIYYHLYSGSKTASLNAVKYVLDWSIKQDVMPIFTSAYIPKAMDYFTVSLANEGEKWLINGMDDLKTLRLEKKDAEINLGNSKTALGIKHFENHTYISLDNSTKHIVDLSKEDKSSKKAYLISANAKIVEFQKGISNQKYTFDGEVDLKLNFHLEDGCQVISLPKPFKREKRRDGVMLQYKNQKRATIDIKCS
jgi:hypothetical protein